VDRHRFDADPDPTFHFDADRTGTGTPGFTMLENRESAFCFYIYPQKGQFIGIVLSFFSTS
jgi:hypothetical protein